MLISLILVKKKHRESLVNQMNSSQFGCDLIHCIVKKKYINNCSFYY